MASKNQKDYAGTCDRWRQTLKISSGANDFSLICHGGYPVVKKNPKKEVVLDRYVMQYPPFLPPSDLPGYLPPDSGTSPRAAKIHGMTGTG